MDAAARTKLLRRIGERVRRLRLARNWSIKELAKHCNLHATYLAQVERGEINIGLGNLITLADTLDCRVGDLVDE